MANLIVSRPKAFRDRFRAYQILLDGIRVGDVRAGDRLEVEIPSGSHLVEARIDWCSSNPISIETSVEPIRLEVGSGWSGWNPLELISRLTLRKNEYLYLKEA